MRDLIPRSVGKIARFQLAVLLLVISAQRLPAPIFELPEKPPQAPGISVNADGSRTLYEVDNAHHRATSTITFGDDEDQCRIVGFRVQPVLEFGGPTPMDIVYPLRNAIAVTVAHASVPTHARHPPKSAHPGTPGLALL